MTKIKMNNILAEIILQNPPKPKPKDNIFDGIFKP